MLRCAFERPYTRRTDRINSFIPYGFHRVLKTVENCFVLIHSGCRLQMKFSMTYSAKGSKSKHWSAAYFYAECNVALYMKQFLGPVLKYRFYRFDNLITAVRQNLLAKIFKRSALLISRFNISKAPTQLRSRTRSRINFPGAPLWFILSASFENSEIVNQGV